MTLAAIGRTTSRIFAGADGTEWLAQPPMPPHPVCCAPLRRSNSAQCSPCVPAARISTKVLWDQKPHGKDPPYFKDLSIIALTALAKIQAIKNGAIIILENAKNEEIPEINNFDLIETRKIGKSKINFFVFKN